MERRNVFRVFGSLLAVLVLAVVGVLAYIWFAGGSGEPSAEVAAAELEPELPESVVYEVVTEESEARFIIDEVLRGQPFTVVGVTDQIDGSVAVDFQSARVEAGEFVVNVRTIKTDDEIRDRSIRTLILESNKDEFEFSTFRPREVRGLPESFEPGDELSFDIIGDLTVRDVTREVTFNAELELLSLNEITGTVGTTIRWDDFELTIPYVGGNSIVSSVADELRLEMAFLAAAR
jgi:polyisoprenoid-binding protein YceI